jgi:hypothetical protein
MTPPYAVRESRNRAEQKFAREWREYGNDVSGDVDAAAGE